MFWAKSWACIRSAGSGSMKYPGPDLLVGNMTKRMAIECKSTRETKLYLSDYDVRQLVDFSKIFDARPWFAIKFPKNPWVFIALDDLQKTPKGYAIDVQQAQLRGLSFEELISY